MLYLDYYIQHSALTHYIAAVDITEKILASFFDFISRQMISCVHVREKWKKKKGISSAGRKKERKKDAGLFYFLNGILWYVTNRNEGGYCCLVLLCRKKLCLFFFYLLLLLLRVRTQVPSQTRATATYYYYYFGESIRNLTLIVTKRKGPLDIPSCRSSEVLFFLFSP